MDTYDLPGLIVKGASMTITELGPSVDSHTPGPQYDRISQPKNTPLLWWETARFYNEAASSALFDLETYEADFNRYYKPEVLRAVKTALQTLRDTVNKR